MSYNIATCTTFMSDLVSAPKTIQNKIKQVMADLKETPNIQRGKRTKKLLGLAHLWRYALEDPEYRIIYEVDEKNKTVKLLRMGPRKDGKIYREIKYTPGKGPDTIPIEIARHVEPEYIAEHPEVLISTPPAINLNAENLPLIDDIKLQEWRVEESYWDTIKRCRTDEELLNADLPQHVQLRIIDCLWPSPIEVVVTQPTFILESEQDFEKVADGLLTRLLLNLDNEQKAAIDPRIEWPILIKGGPGTGKSIVAIYKAVALVKEKPLKKPRILFTTYTNSLTNSSRNLFDAYLGDQEDIEIRTVTGVAAAICRMNNEDLEFITSDERINIAKKLLDNLDNEKRKSLPDIIDAHYLSEEIEWVIEGWCLQTLNEYLQINREGRKQGLNPKQRQIVWSVYEDFRNEVANHNKITYEQLQAKAFEYCKKARSNNPGVKCWKFDYVFIDEAQDLKPIGLKLCASLCRNPANVYLTADPNQAIYSYGKGNSTWESVVDSLKFDRKNTKNLKKNYRSTDQILRASGDIVIGLKGIDAETVYTEPIYAGAKPVFKLFDNEVSRNQEIAYWIKSTLRELRLPFSCAAILCPTQRAVQSMVDDMLAAELPAEGFLSSESSLDTTKVKVITIHSSKGLEFPVVVVPDYKSSAFSWLDPNDDEAMIEMARKLYFVACTRAMRRLFVGAIGSSNDQLHALIKTDNWNITSAG